MWAAVLHAHRQWESTNKNHSQNDLRLSVKRSTTNETVVATENSWRRAVHRCSVK